MLNKTSSFIGEMVSIQFYNFYTSLYTSKNIPNEEINEYLSNIDILEVNANDKNMMNKFPSYKQC